MIDTTPMHIDLPEGYRPTRNHKPIGVDGQRFIDYIDLVLYALESLEQVKPIRPEDVTDIDRDWGIVWGESLAPTEGIDPKELSNEALAEYIKALERKITYVGKRNNGDRKLENAQNVSETALEMLEEIHDRTKDTKGLKAHYDTVIKNAEVMRAAHEQREQEYRDQLAKAEEEQRMRMPPTREELAEAVRILREGKA